MPETQAYRILFNKTDFVTVTLSPPSISAFADDGKSTCGGVWHKDLDLKSPTADMSFADRDAVHAANRKKIAAQAPDPHEAHRAILSHAITVATPENLLSYGLAVGPENEVVRLVPDLGHRPKHAGNIEIGDDEDKRTVPIVSVIDVITQDTEDAPNTTVTTLPSSWKIEPV